MIYKISIYLLLFFLFSCANQNLNQSNNKIFETYSNKGFALIYNKNLLKKKIVNKKIDQRSLIIFNNNLNNDTSVKITNLLNNKNLIAKVSNKSKYPTFYNAVISERIANDLEIDILEPYIQIQTIDLRNSFIASKAKTFDEEKKVANKAPVKSIKIQNIGSSNITNNKSKLLKNKTFKYIIKFADFYFNESALLLKKRLIEEFNINDVSIKKMSKNRFRVFKGPFNNLESIKNEFNDINKLNFENIEIIKLWLN